jgi:hypothetical protein
MQVRFATQLLLEENVGLVRSMLHNSPSRYSKPARVAIYETRADADKLT